MTKEPTPDQTIEMLQRERDSLLDRVEGLRWMVDQMNKDSETIIYDAEIHGPVYAAVAYTWGPRCDEYEPGCSCCAAWEEYDMASNFRAENKRLRETLRDAYEIYAGSDGFIPVTAAEGYQQQIIRQMVNCISAALEGK